MFVIKSIASLIAYYVMGVGLFAIITGDEMRVWIFGIGLIIIGGVIYIVGAIDQIKKGPE